MCSQCIHNSSRAPSPSTSPGFSPLWVVPGSFSVHGGNLYTDLLPPVCFCVDVKVTGWAFLVGATGARHVWPVFYARTKQSYWRLKTSSLDGNLSFQAIWEVTVETRMPWQRWPGVTEETTVTMETASQRAIFEASKEKRAPSLIAVCAREWALCFPVSRVSCIDNETLTVGWPLCLFGAVYALSRLAYQDSSHQEIILDYLFFFKDNSIWTRL